MHPTNSLHPVLNNLAGTLSFIVFTTLNCGFDLFMARRRNLHAVIIDRVQYIISKSGIVVVIALQQSRAVFPPQPQHLLRICYQVSILTFVGRRPGLKTFGQMLYLFIEFSASNAQSKPSCDKVVIRIDVWTSECANIQYTGYVPSVNHNVINVVG